MHKFHEYVKTGAESEPLRSAVRLIVYITERNKCFDRKKGDVFFVKQIFEGFAIPEWKFSSILLINSWIKMISPNWVGEPKTVLV